MLVLLLVTAVGLSLGIPAFVSWIEGPERLPALDGLGVAAFGLVFFFGLWALRKWGPL